MRYQFITVNGQPIRITLDDNGVEVTRENFISSRMDGRTSEWFADIGKMPEQAQIVAALGFTPPAPNAPIGYSAGVGGSVTQLTSRSTTVILNALCGNITMFSAAQGAQAVVTFTLTNSYITANDFILIKHISTTNAGAWNFSVVAGAGSCSISVRNVSTASITAATPLRFTIIKGAVT